MVFGKAPGRKVLLNYHNFYMSHVTPYEAPSLNFSSYLNKICKKLEGKKILTPAKNPYLIPLKSTKTAFPTLKCNFCKHRKTFTA